MDFAGWEKLSLLDFDGYISTTLFTYGCNFKCPFCHNKSLVLDANKKLIPFDEIIAYLKKRHGIIEGVCISGGEPTIMNDLVDKIKVIKNLNYKVKLDSNGTNPDLIKYLFEHNLIDYFAMDIKNSLDKYSEIIGLKNYSTSNILKTINFLLNSNYNYEFRTTIIKEFHTLNDFEKIGKLIQNCPRYFLQKYIDSSTCIRNGFTSFSLQEALQIQKIVAKYVKNVSLRGY